MEEENGTLHCSLLMQKNEDNRTRSTSSSESTEEGREEEEEEESNFWRTASPKNSFASIFIAAMGGEGEGVGGGGGGEYGSNFQFAILSVVIVVGIVVLLPVMLMHAVEDLRNHRPDFAAFYSAGVAVLITVVLSMRQIYSHLTHWYMPDVQKYVVRIVWMVPLYAVHSWLSLRFARLHTVIDAMRDLYEAFVIQSFVYYLIELLGGEETLSFTLQQKEDHYGHHHRITARCLRRWEMGTEFMLKCKHGVLQYVVVKTILTILTFFLEPLGLYGEGKYDWNKAYIYISLSINLSQMWALYCLIKFFHATSQDLRYPKNWHPIGKFLCVKGVVFFTWWQGCLIAFLQSRQLISTAHNAKGAIQDYIICIEMLFFALAHAFTFTYQEYLPPSVPKPNNTFWPNSLFYPSHYNPAPNNNNNHNEIQSIDFFPEGTLDHHHNTQESPDYHPPMIRTLRAPMRISDAFWSSTLPTEALSDIRRLRNGVSDEVMSLADDPGMISMASIQHHDDPNAI